MPIEHNPLPIHIGFPETRPLVSAQLTDMDKAFIEKMRREHKRPKSSEEQEKPRSL